MNNAESQIALPCLLLTCVLFTHTMNVLRKPVSCSSTESIQTPFACVSPAAVGQTPEGLYYAEGGCSGGPRLRPVMSQTQRREHSMFVFFTFLKSRATSDCHWKQHSTPCMLRLHHGTTSTAANASNNYRRWPPSFYQGVGLLALTQLCTNVLQHRTFNHRSQTTHSLSLVI